MCPSSKAYVNVTGFLRSRPGKNLADGDDERATSHGVATPHRNHSRLSVVGKGNALKASSATFKEFDK